MNPFGAWHKCRGKNHYFLGGVPLCGARAKETGQPPDRVYATGPNAGRTSRRRR